uniref:Reverse transcriptase domain-containing protein n=1 Tax=Tanacetum cinerariifolium TaxID=118510 RepID=A0A699WTU3_TANCI|nr:reverse transcriptase domain-containing protein [Tanacetum cinerariifolium]
MCAEKMVRIPWGNETLIIHGDGSNRGNVTQLSIISCTKTEKYVKKGFYLSGTYYYEGSRGQVEGEAT